MATAARQHLAKCVETVRTHDRWHFLCSTFLSPERRANSLIVHALNCELDQISAKCYFYFSRAHEMGGQLEKIRATLHTRLRTATLRNDFEGQVRLCDWRQSWE